MGFPNPTDLLLWLQIAQAFATTLAIVAAGAWTYFVFFKGRTAAPNMHIEIILANVSSQGSNRYANLSVRFKNVGKTQVRRKACFILLKAVRETQEGLQQFVTVEDSSPIDPEKEEDIPTIRTLKEDEQEILEPDQEVLTYTLIALGEVNSFKATAYFLSKPDLLQRAFGKQEGRTWSSTAIFDARMFEKESVRQTQTSV